MSEEKEAKRMANGGWSAMILARVLLGLHPWIQTASSQYEGKMGRVVLLSVSNWISKKISWSNLHQSTPYFLFCNRQEGRLWSYRRLLANLRAYCALAYLYQCLIVIDNSCLAGSFAVWLWYLRSVGGLLLSCNTWLDFMAWTMRNVIFLQLFSYEGKSLFHKRSSEGVCPWYKGRKGRETESRLQREGREAGNFPKGGADCCNLFPIWHTLRRSAKGIFSCSRWLHILNKQCLRFWVKKACTIFTD